MTRLSIVFLGVILASSFALPVTPAQAAPGSVLVAKAKKKPKKKPKTQKKPPKGEAKTPAIEKGMKVVALGDASVVDSPSESGAQVYRATEGQVLTVVKVQKKWVRVKNADGEQGWLQAAEVVPKEVFDAQAGDNGGGGEDEGEKGKGEDETPSNLEEGGGGGDEATAEDEDAGKKKKKRRDDDEDGGGGGDGGGTELMGRAKLNGKLRIAAGAQVAGLVRTQTFASKGTNAFANYTININSPAADLFARVTRKGGKLELGAELGFMATFGNSGITVGSGAAVKTLAWAERQIDVRVLAGYHIAPGYLISARVGYRVMNTDIDDSDAIKQPSEVLSGVALGAEVVAYGLSPKLELRLGAETLVAASLEQTAKYKDGENSTVSPVYVFAEGAYLYSPRLSIVGGYTLAYESYAWSGTSARDAANGNGTRTDVQHLFSIGAQLWF